LKYPLRKRNEMKRILITGTSSGFGKTIAEHLHNIGHTVVGTSRNPEKTDSEFTTLRLDVNDESNVKETVRQFIEMNKSIDVLINNAGYGIAGPIENTSIEEAKDQFDTNFFGGLRMIQAFLPYMREKKNGLILNIGSIGGQIGLPFQGFYSASKFALEGLTESLRIELKPFNVNVVNINPGDFATNFTANRRIVKNVSEDYQTKFDAALKVYENDERNGSDPEIIAQLVERLISEEKNYQVRYLVGDRLQKMGVKLKGLIGSKGFEKLMMSTYNQN